VPAWIHRMHWSMKLLLALILIAVLVNIASTGLVPK
jgi:energy-coupling factor transporter transmembrane protein EcfT